MQVKQTILDQKKHRLNKQFIQFTTETNEIDKSHKFLQNEMVRLNRQHALYEAAQEKLKNENYNINSEFIQKLKQLE